MTDIDSMIAVLQAARDGKTIQYKRVGRDGIWLSLAGENPTWNFEVCEYRVKPEPVKRYARCSMLTIDWIDGREPNLELEFFDGVLKGAKVL